VLRSLAQQSKVVAIGEIGLDYYRQRAPQHLQKEIFERQLELAAELGLPVIIHSRQAAKEHLNILVAWHKKLSNNNLPIANRPGGWHSFSGDIQTAITATQRGFFIGVNGPITYQNALEHQSVVSQLPLEHLLLETDAPFLPPHPFRGQRNEPAYLEVIAEKLASLHHTTPIVVARTTTQNAERLFAWRTKN